MQGAHRLNKKGVVAYDEILRVPLIVRVPGRDSTRDRIPDLISNRAIPSTLFDAAGIDAPAEFDAESALDAFKREQPADDDRVFFEHRYAYWGDHPYRGVRTSRWKYVEYFGDETSELYDMISDPHELINLASEPDHAETVDLLRDSLHEWWTESGGDDDWWLEPISGL
jgi:arylsulfatase A-like enzyme